MFVVKVQIQAGEALEVRAGHDQARQRGDDGCAVEIDGLLVLPLHAGDVEFAHAPGNVWSVAESAAKLFHAKKMRVVF